MTLRKILFLVFINILVLAGFLLALELGTRLLVETHSDNRSFRLTRPAPYRDAPYFSREFIEEAFTQPGGWETPPGTNLLLPNDYNGKYFHVEDGIRRTTDTPPGADRAIFLFGGSTMYNSEVPDAYTIASYLQRKLVAGGYVSYRVVNLGVTSVNTIQQLERLRLTDISNGDIVIFYDGVNEVIQGVLYGNAGDTIVNRDRNRPLWQKILYKIANHSVLARHTLDRIIKNYTIDNLDVRIQQTVSRYRKNIDEAEQFASARGARFLHFLQPNLFTLARPGEYENSLQKLEIIPVQAEKAFRSTYPFLVDIVEERSRQGHAEFNLTGVFDKLEKPVYLDFCHVNHVANEAIADAIFSGLVKSGAVKRP